MSKVERDVVRELLWDRVSGEKERVASLSDIAEAKNGFSGRDEKSFANMTKKSLTDSDSMIKVRPTSNYEAANFDTYFLVF